MHFSPLEQFEVYPLIFTMITNVNFFFVILFVFLYYAGRTSVASMTVLPFRQQYVAEQSYSSLVSTLGQQTGVPGIRYFSIFFWIFSFIFIANFVGLIPYGYTISSQFILIFSLAASFNLGFTVLGFYVNGIGFLKLFVPSGVPPALVPLIVVIEILSYAIRTFSLSLRLCANMVAGHTLIFILGSFAAMLMESRYFLVVWMPILMIGPIMILEIGIAALQAYVFFVLLAIYCADAFGKQH